MVKGVQGYRRIFQEGAVAALRRQRLRLSNRFRRGTLMNALFPPVDQPWRAGERHSSSESMVSLVESRTAK